MKKRIQTTPVYWPVILESILTYVVSLCFFSFIFSLMHVPEVDDPYSPRIIAAIVVLYGGPLVLAILVARRGVRKIREE
jgi:hypothetical protein